LNNEQEKELVIQSSSKVSNIALLEDQGLVEFHQEKLSDDFLVGDIYLGKVKKVMSGLNAAFVDIGHEKDAFLHFLDLGPNFPTLNDFVNKVYRRKLNTSSLKNFRFLNELDKSGKITDVLDVGQPIAVQLVKEPISTKGPRLSSELTIPGRFMILMPFKDTISVSKRVKSRKEKDRLKKIIAGIKPKNFGVIVRTQAEGKNVEQLEEDFNKQYEKWDEIFKNLSNKERKVFGEVNRASTLLRDLLNNSFNKIWVDDKQIYNQLKSYIGEIAPQHQKIIKFYKNKTPLFQHLDVDRQIKSLFGQTVNVGGGAYLVIEHTEAMHVIDINSGSKRTKEISQEQNAVKTNLQSVTEIGRQLRLRDMGGIIVVDFIDMNQAENRKMIHEKMKEVLKDDRAKYSLLPITKFGLMQITRQRVRPEVTISTAETCPVCKGSGEINPTILLVDQIENQVQYVHENTQYKVLNLQVHPYISAYLKEGFPNLRMKWMAKYKLWINVEPSESLYLTQFYLLNKDKKDIQYS